MADQLHELARQMRANSERWFADFHATDPDLCVFYALGMAGEAGEVANLIKKRMRGSTIEIQDLYDELADVFTYLLLLADEVGVDLESAYRGKARFNEARWGEK